MTIPARSISFVKKEASELSHDLKDMSFIWFPIVSGETLPAGPAGGDQEGAGRDPAGGHLSTQVAAAPGHGQDQQGQSKCTSARWW